jgi:5-methylcytosine-specific restriction protein A
VANPRSNPAYCYNWSFGGTNEPSITCLWHESFSVEDGRIVCRGNIRQLAADLENVASRPEEDGEVKIRARNQAARARAVDDLVRKAAAGDRVLRVIVNEGHMRSEKSLGYDRSAVKVRILDGTPWRVDQYTTESGDFVIVRGSEVAAIVSAAHVPGPGPAVGERPKKYSDQFDAGKDEADRHHVEGFAYERDPAVRAEVLERAEGLCEFCNAPGFVTRGGTIYLESHHVVPLSESGSDRVWNVVALCPNDHREAHFSERSPEIRAGLLEFLSARYPSNER